MEYIILGRFVTGRGLLMLVAGALLAIAVLMTPVASIWTWLAIDLGLWVAAEGRRALGIA